MLFNSGSQQKAQEKQFVDARRTKDRYSAALAAYHQIRQSADKDQSWKWAKTDIDEAQQYLDELQAERDRSQFWHRWFPDTHMGHKPINVFL